MALLIGIDGRVRVNNLPEYRGMLAAFLGTINRELASDEQFGQAELDSRKLREIEDNVRAAKVRALEDAKGIQDLFAALDMTSEEVRKARLELDRQIAKRKEEVRAGLLSSAMESLDCAARYRCHFSRSLAEAMKGKRTLDSIKRALDATIAVNNGMIRRSRALIDAHIARHGTALVMDREDLEIRLPDVVEGELRRRVEACQAEVERRRLTEEAANARAGVAGITADHARQDHARICSGAKPDSPPPRVPVPGPAAEWEAFWSRVKAGFQPVREAMAALRHELNVRAAETFAAGVNEAARTALATRKAKCVREGGGGS